MHRTNLMLHCGGAQVAREEVYGTETPDRTDTWYPIPHHTLIERVEESLGRANLRVVNEAHALAYDGARYFGLFQVANGQNSDDYAWILGLRNSHDRSFNAGLVVGSQVFVCDNLAFSGEIRIGRKHTRFIERDLPLLTTAAIGQLAARWHRQDERINAYREREISPAEAHDLIIRGLDCRAITATQVPEVLRHWREPQHPEFAEDRSAWRLFNAFTETQKGTSVWNMPRRTQATHGLFDGLCGIAGIPAQIAAMRPRAPEDLEELDDVTWEVAAA